MTLHHHGYALLPGESLEDLDVGGGSVLSLRVTGEQSNGLVTVIEGIVNDGGPLLHVHESEDEVVIVLDGELAYQSVKNAACSRAVVCCGSPPCAARCG